MTELTMIHVSTPFSPSDYYRANTARRIELLKQWAAKAAEHGAPFSWEDLRKRFEANPKAMISCEHEVQTLRTVLDYEAALEAAAVDFETLRASMEDLCKEMDEVRGTANQTFVMGPGTK